MSIDLYEACKAQVRDGASELALGPFLASLIWITRAQRALDVGTGHGGSAIAMAIAMRAMDRDPFPTPNQHRDCRGGGIAPLPRSSRVTTIELPNVIHTEFTDEVDRLGLNDYIEVIKADCFDCVETFTSHGAWDVVFVDATKTVDEVVAFLPLVRADGFFVLHDYYGSGVGVICRDVLDGFHLIEGILCDTGFMSFKCYRIKEPVGRDVLRARFAACGMP